MKRILITLSFLLVAIAAAWAQPRYNVVQMPLCWTVGSVDSSITRYVLVSSTGAYSTVLYLDAAGQEVIYTGGTLRNGHCDCCQGAGIDSTFVQNDSVFISSGGNTYFSGIASASVFALNGLNMSGDTTKLGGPLTENTTITGGALNFVVTGTNTAEVLRVNNTSGNGSALRATATGFGAALVGFNSSGNGILGQSNASDGVRGEGANNGVYGTGVNGGSFLGTTAGVVGNATGNNGIGGWFNYAANNQLFSPARAALISHQPPGTTSNGVGARIGFNAKAGTTIKDLGNIGMAFEEINAPERRRFFVDMGGITQFEILSDSIARLNRYSTGANVGTGWARAVFGADGTIYADSTGVTGTINGTSSQTMRHNGSNWVASSNITNDGGTNVNIEATNIRVGATTLNNYVGVGVAPNSSIGLVFIRGPGNVGGRPRLVVGGNTNGGALHNTGDQSHPTLVVSGMWEKDALTPLPYSSFYISGGYGNTGAYINSRINGNGGSMSVGTYNFLGTTDSLSLNQYSSGAGAINYVSLRNKQLRMNDGLDTPDRRSYNFTGTYSRVDASGATMINNDLGVGPSYTAYGGEFYASGPIGSDVSSTTYGIRTLGSGATRNYGIVSAAGNNHFAGNTRIGSTLDSAQYTLEVIGTALVTGSSTLPSVTVAGRDSLGVFTELPITHRGSASDTTDGSGDLTISQAMPDATFVVTVAVTGTTPYIATVHDKSTSGFKIRFFDTTGAAVTSTAVTVDWTATDN